MQMKEQQSYSKRKTEGTFIVNIKYRENATWQGVVTWADKKQKQCFRSTLELIKMIDSALDEEEENES